MESRARIRERHGVANARRCSAASVENSEIQTVEVTDGFGEVLLSLGSSSFPAGLTPDQARMIAMRLNEAAARVAVKLERGEPRNAIDQGALTDAEN